MEDRKIDWESLKPSNDAQIDWDSLRPAAETSPGVDPSPSGPDGIRSQDRIQRAWNQAKDTAMGALSKAPIVGFSADQFTETKEVMSDVFGRPLAALTALAVDTPFAGAEVGIWDTLKEGFLYPEKYPPEEMTTALMDAGMEPYEAASLATLGQFGYYLGTGRAFGKAMSKLEVRNTKALIETLEYQLNDAGKAGQKFLKLSPEMSETLAKNVDQRVVADLYAKSRGYKFVGTDGIKMVDPKLAAEVFKTTPESAIRSGELRVDRLGKFMDIQKVGATKEQFADKIPGVKQLRAMSTNKNISDIKDFLDRRGASKLVEMSPDLEGIKGEKRVMDAALTVYRAISGDGFANSLYKNVEVSGQSVSSQAVQSFVKATMQLHKAFTSGQTVPPEILAQYLSLGEVLGVVAPTSQYALDEFGMPLTMGDVLTAPDKAQGVVPETPVEDPALAVPTEPAEPVTIEDALATLQDIDPKRGRVGLDAVITPSEYVLKQLGLDEYIGSPIRRALQDTRIELAQKLEFLVKTMKQHLGPITDPAERAKAIETVWQYMDKGIPEGNTAEIKVAKAFRKETDEMLRRINETNKYAGLPELKGLKDYIYHMVMPEVIDEMISTGQIPDGFKKIMKPGVTKELFLKTAQERKGMPEEFLVKDPYEVMRVMYSIDLKYINLQRALAETAPYIKALKQMASTEEKWDATVTTYIDNWIAYGVQRKPMNVDLRAQASLDWLLDVTVNKIPGVHKELSFDQLTGAISAAAQTGALGLRAKAAIRNLVQSTFDWVAYGTQPYLKGQAMYVTQEGFDVLKRSRMWKSRMPIEAQDRNTLSKFMKMGSVLYRKADLRNVGVGLLTRYYYAKDTLGMTDKAALDFADTDVAGTQWSYTREDLPEIYWSASGRTLSTFGSWWMNFYTRFMPELIGKAFTGKSADGRDVPVNERLGMVRFLVLLGTAEVVRRKSKRYLGIALDYTGAILPGFGRLSPQAQFMTGVVEIAQGLQERSDRKWKEGWRKVGQSSQIFIPYWLGIKDMTQLLTGQKSLGETLMYTDTSQKKRKGSMF